MEHYPPCISIPLQSSKDEVIEISCNDLPQGEEVRGILESEHSKLSKWIEAALAYYRNGRINDFLLILESAGSQAGLEYPEVQTDQMRALDILAAHWMQAGHREKNKEQQKELFHKATVLFNTADKISMYEWFHLTVRAWFYLYEKENRVNKLDLAHQQFDFVVKTHPSNVLSLIGKAVIAYNRNDLKSCVFYFRKAIRQRRCSVPDLRVGLGYCFAKMGKPEKARIAFERALELDNNNVSAMCGLAIILLNTLESENFNIAIQLFGRAYQLHQEHPVVLVHLANHFFFKKEYERVQQLAWHAMQSTESESIKSEACYQLARLKHVQQQYDSAFKYYYQAKSLNNGEHTLAYYGLGQLYIYRNEIEEAIKCFEKVYERMPNNVETMKILGSLYAQVSVSDPVALLDTRRKGRELLSKYLGLVPEDIEASIELAQLLEAIDPQKSLELYEKAIELLKTVEDIDPQPEMLNNLGSLYMQMKEFEKSKTYFEQALLRLTEMLETQERNEKHQVHLLTIRYNLARCLECLCRTTEAEQMYKDIIAECPNYIDCYMRLGCLTRDRGQIYDSSVWFKNALQYDQTSADAWTLIGNLHMSKNEWQPAQKKFEHILSKGGNKNADAYSLISLGNVWLEQLMNPNRKKEDEKKYMDRALVMYTKALKLQPKNIMAANGVGCVIAFKKSWDLAKDVFSQVREATSEFLDVWINIAHIYMEKEQYMPAVQMYTSAMKKFNHMNDPTLLHYLSKAYYRANMIEEAKETLEKALLESNDNLLIKFNYAVVMKRNARNIMKGIKVTSEKVMNAIEDLKFAERILMYISTNDDLTLPGAKLLSRKVCAEEAQNCRDLMAQANHKLEEAMAQDEEERHLKMKQEKEKEELRRKMMEEARMKEEMELKKKIEVQSLRKSFIEMTKSFTKLPTIPDEKRGRSGGGGGRRRKQDDEFVNDSSDEGRWNDGEGEVEGGRERKKKDKSKKSRKRRERSGSDGERAERRKKKREEKERRMAEKLSAKQNAKIKSRAFLSSSEDSSDNEKEKEENRSEDDEQREESPPPPIIGGSDDSDEESDREKATKKKKKTVVDSDDSSGSDQEAPLIGASSGEEDEPGRRGSDDSDSS